MNSGARSRLAAVDVGSNTVHALVADWDGERLIEAGHFVEMPELGGQVDATGRIGPAGPRAISALRAVVAQASELGAGPPVAGATAAVRRAADRDAFLTLAGEAIGVPVRLISEDREAQLTFAGAALEHAPAGEWLLVDAGGGSTEIVVGHHRIALRWANLALGSGVLAARFLSDPPVAAEREELRRHALTVLAGAPDSDAGKLVVTGGTASNLPGLLGSGHELGVAALLEAQRRLDAGPAARVALASHLPAARIRALRAGVELLLLLLDWYGVDRLHVSHAGLRQGMLLAYLERGESWWTDQS